MIGSGSKRWPPASRTPRSTPAWVQVVRALIAGQLGRLEDARRALDAVAPRLASLPRDSEWLAVMAQVAEVIALIGTHPVGAWVYDALLPYADLFAVEGIGAAVRGPLHRHLGLLATASGSTDDAREHFDSRAWRVSQALGATQLTARIEAEAAATALVTAIDTERPNVFRRDGELWVLRFEGREVQAPGRQGVAGSRRCSSRHRVGRSPPSTSPAPRPAVTPDRCSIVRHVTPTGVACRISRRSSTTRAPWATWVGRSVSPPSATRWSNS